MWDGVCGGVGWCGAVRVGVVSCLMILLLLYDIINCTAVYVNVVLVHFVVLYFASLN